MKINLFNLDNDNRPGIAWIISIVLVVGKILNIIDISWIYCFLPIFLAIAATLSATVLMAVTIVVYKINNK